jgi:hypothetical protein
MTPTALKNVCLLSTGRLKILLITRLIVNEGWPNIIICSHLKDGIAGVILVPLDSAKGKGREVTSFHKAEAKTDQV